MDLSIWTHKDFEIEVIDIPLFWTTQYFKTMQLKESFKQYLQGLTAMETNKFSNWYT